MKTKGESGKMSHKERRGVEPDILGRYLIVVLGMHRSGTSALGGVLHHLGCELPKSPMPANENNPKGYFESLQVYQLNDEILRAVKSSWRDWREINPNWFASAQGQTYLHRAREVLLHEFEETRLGVLKDPRICRMVPFWAEAARLAGFQLLPILTHRNPLEVAKSLQTRDGIDTSEGMLVWLRHVLDAEAGTRGMRRCSTSYTAILRNWVKQVQTIQDSLNIVLPQFDDRSSMEIETFLSRGLRHFDEVPEKVIENPTLSIWVRDTYEILERWIRKPESKADYKRLDQIRTEFNSAAPAFGQLVGAPEENRFSLQAKIQIAQKELSAATERATSAETRGAELAQELASAQKQREAVQAELTQVQVYVADLEGQKAQIEARAAEAEDSCAQLTRAIEDDAQRHGALQNELSLALRQLKAVESAGEDLRNELERKDALLDELEGLKQKFRDELAQTQSALAQRALEAEQQAARAKRAEDERDAEKAGVAALEREVSGLQDDVRAANAALAEARAAHRSELAEEVARWRRKTDALSAELTGLRSAAAQDQEHIGVLKAQVVSGSTERASLEAAGQSKAKRLSEVEASRDAHMHEARRLAEEMEALRSSTSWRLTGPLRRLVMLLRGNG